MKLWLARHAAPLIAPGLCYGRLDIEADDHATAASARALAAALPQGLPVRVSGLRRAEQLARALQALRADLRPERDARLNEMDFGAWEGLPWADIPKAAIDDWTAHFADYRPGGGENVSEVLRRVGQALADAAAQGEVAWITHAGVIRAAHYLARRGRDVPPRAEIWPVEAPGYGEWASLASADSASESDSIIFLSR